MEGFLETSDTLNSRQFHIAVKRLADSLNYGTDRSAFLGSGLDYVQSRPYQWGDPIRAIDWRITARTGKVHIKEYEATKRLPCYLLIDTSASMTVSSTARSKYATALFIAGGLAFASLDRASPVGVMSLGSQEFRSEPSLSADEILRWMHRLRHYRFDESTAIATKLSDLSNRLPCRSLVIILSDLHQPEAERSIKLMAQRHDCIVLQLRDPAEKGLPGIGFFRGQEAETGRVLTGHGRMKWLEQQNVTESLRRAGVDHLLIDIDQPYVRKLRYFLQARNSMSRGAR